MKTLHPMYVLSRQFRYDAAVPYVTKALKSRLGHNRKVDANDIDDIVQSAALMFQASTGGKYWDLSETDVTKMSCYFACRKAFLYAKRSRLVSKITYMTAEEIDAEPRAMSDDLMRIDLSDLSANLQAIVDAIFNGVKSKTELAETLGISRPTLDKRLAELLNAI